jgi:hypothetical protein
MKITLPYSSAPTTCHAVVIQRRIGTFLPADVSDEYSFLQDLYAETYQPVILTESLGDRIIFHYELANRV